MGAIRDLMAADLRPLLGLAGHDAISAGSRPRRREIGIAPCPHLADSSALPSAARW
jgi:hypothetical protein